MKTSPGMALANSLWVWHYSLCVWYGIPGLENPNKRRVYALLVANGATIPPDGADADDAYLCKVRAAGGFPAYEMAHRMRLTATCARVVFPRLPVDAVSHVVAFAFHTGYY